MAAGPPVGIHRTKYLEEIMKNLAPTLFVYDTEQQEVELSSLWEATPVVLVFVRHFG